MYQYDQLNRIKQSKSGFYENELLTMGNKYFSSYNYDANGNITHLKRRDKGGNLFDDFTYNYNTALAGLQNNKLRSVIDVNSAYDGQYNDITAGQSIDNYQYDEIGNLIADESEEIEKIEWNVYGKVAAIHRTNNSNKDYIQFFYDAMGNRVAKQVVRKTSNGLDWDNPTTTVYVRDASGNVMATYTLDHDNEDFTINPKVEYTLYGSSRLGITTLEIDEQIGNSSNDFANFKRETGNKMYELSNHLGNVGVVISDKRLGEGNFYAADVVSATDYYPFGMQMPLRSYTGESYRFVFNGMENANDIAPGNYTTPFREIDTRLGGRWWSTDPIVKPWESPYAGFSNNPIYFSDPSGLDPEKGDKKKKTKECQNCMKDNEGKDIVVNIPEVTTTANKNKTPQDYHYHKTWTSERTFSDYHGSLKSWNEKYGVNGWSYDEAFEYWRLMDGNPNGGSNHDNHVAEMAIQSKNNELLGKLGFFTAYFYAIEDVANVYTPAVGMQVVTRMAHGGRLFKYVPRGGTVKKIHINESDNILTLTEKNKFKASFNVEGSASEFYKNLNSSWDGSLFNVTKEFIQTSFKYNGGKVTLTTTSKSTNRASVKIIEDGGYSIFFRFSKF